MKVKGILDIRAPSTLWAFCFDTVVKKGSCQFQNHRIEFVQLPPGIKFQRSERCGLNAIARQILNPNFYYESEERSLDNFSTNS